MLSKTIKFCKEREKDIILVMVIVFISLISFGFGRLSKVRENKTPIVIENAATAAVGFAPRTEEKTAPRNNQEKIFVASKKGARYHYPWCSGALRIKETNKIWFSKIEEARAAGYTPAANCKGLK